MSKIIEDLKSLISLVEIDELTTVEPPIYYTINMFCQCKISDFSTSLLLIQSCLDRVVERLNMGNWKDVSIGDRKCITVLSLLKVIVFLEKEKNITDEVIQKSYKIIDNGLIFGAPLSISNGDLLQKCAKILSKFQIGSTIIDSSNNVDDTNSKDSSIFIKQDGSSSNLSATETDNFGLPVCKISCPSIEMFHNEYFANNLPAVLTDCINHWPALTLWSDLNYLLKKAGHRTVPIELGSKYTDNDWTQRLTTLREFITKHIYEASPTIGYLAQHQLFNQIPELLEDIKIPEYCCLREQFDDDSEISQEMDTIDESPDLNAWFGPPGTISPLHFDPKHNLLAQVVGEKLIILYSPDESPNLYSHPDNMLQNTAQVDPVEPDFIKFPKFKNAKPQYCLLKPGDMLYIPPKWWHYVKSLSISFSVSFWWK